MAWPARVKEVQSLRGASANQPSIPAYARALTNWPPSNPIPKLSSRPKHLPSARGYPFRRQLTLAAALSRRRDPFQCQIPGLRLDDLEHLGMTTPEDWDGFVQGFVQDDIWRCWCKGLSVKAVRRNFVIVCPGAVIFWSNHDVASQQDK